MIKNVIFDIGNVLVDFRWRSLMDCIFTGRLPVELPCFGNCRLMKGLRKQDTKVRSLSKIRNCK